MPNIPGEPCFYSEQHGEWWIVMRSDDENRQGREVARRRDRASAQRKIKSLWSAYKRAKRIKAAREN